MKVLVTGATGFIGGALAADFIARGFETIAVGGPNSNETSLSVNVGDNAAVQKMALEKGVDAVVHAAGLAHRFEKVSDNEFRRVNVNGVANIANLAQRLGAKHFLLFSSTLVYGKRSRAAPITETDECRPIETYGQSKLEGENEARRVCEVAGIDLTIFRPAPVMGEGSKGNFARLIRAIDRRRFVWVGDGENLKSVVYVGDVAKAAGMVLEKGGSGIHVFNIAADAVRMNEIVNAIAAALGRKAPSFHLPAAPAKAAANAVSMFGGKFKRLAATLDTWLGDDVYSNKKLKDTLGFKPETSLATAVGREVGYYLKQR